MGTRIDPKGLELQVLHRLIDFRGKDVLEIGCGDGRMTLRFAERARSVTAFDPDEALIATARAQTPEAMKSKLTLRAAGIHDIALPDDGYDVAVLSRSL